MSEKRDVSIQLEVNESALRRLQSELLTTAEAADLLRVRVETLAQWRWRGTGPAYLKNGSRVLYRREAIEAWLSAGEVRP